MPRLPAALALLVLTSAARAAAPDVDFSRDVKPILSGHCFACHGPDEGPRKGDLRLDLRDDAMKAGAFVPGKASESEIIARILSHDPETAMPPPRAKKAKVTPAELDILKRWIDQGAKYDAHWAYAPPKPAPPGSTIDGFVNAELAARKLTPVGPADRRTLARRLTLDLTGLPPTPERADAYVHDTRPDAHARFVESLLAEPAYGERMAMYWLDLVRYADTDGYHADNERPVSEYRDYVIRAFNDNMPFDRFTREQLAGDLLPNPTRDQRVASGYNRLLMTTEEGGAQAKEYMAKYVADRVRNTSGVWLAQTMGCAECHNHKYDPITQRDFYRWGSFFTDIQETAVGKQSPTPVPTAAHERRTAELRAALERAKAGPEKVSSVWTTATPTKAESRGKATLATQPDGSILASGANPDTDVYTLTLPIAADRVTGVRLEALRHPSLAGGRLSRANGNFVLTDVKASLTRKGESKPANAPIARAAASFEQANYPVAHALDNNTGTGWAVSGHERDFDAEAVFTLAKPIDNAAGGTLTLTLKFESPDAGHAIGRARVSLTGVDTPTFGAETPAVAAARRALAEHEAAGPTTLVSTSGGRRVLRVLPRGNWLDETGDQVAPGTPGYLPNELGRAGQRPAGRLELADWLTSRDNPLVARVFVNRVWKLLFGQGIVRSAEDFGTQGTPPTHPALLDHLAADFVASGWDIKRLVRTIVATDAYRRSSVPTKALREADPTNQWLGRQNRYRVDAETVRDTALAVSGLLNTRVGGASVKPYQPAGYWSYLNFPKREWQNVGGADQYRRGLYTFWCRSFLHPSLAAFDAPTREECTADRPRSSTPLQALVLLNDPTYVEAARAFAASALATPGTPSERVDRLFRRALCRPATDAERGVLLVLVEKHRADYSADPKAAEELLKVGQSPAPPGDRAELAAWTGAARVVLNLHEVLTRN